MNQFHQLFGHRWRIALASLAAGLVVACGGGGGGGSGGIDTGGTGSFSAGPISGFGSVIVNGVRFDDSKASFSDDDDDAVSSSSLKLGMMVEIEAGHITPGTTDTLGASTATSINVVSEIKGPVEVVGAGTLTVLGQAVTVTAGTVLEEGLSLDAIAVGDVLEVFGFSQAGGQITATRIEKEDAGTSSFKLRGFIANLDGMARTFTIGAARISYAGISSPPVLANGSFVRVRLNTTKNAGGLWVATRLETRRAIDNGDEAEVEGVITAYSGVGTNFELNGLPVNASGAQFEDGSTANLAVGVRVEVEGSVQNGVLVAKKVEFRDNNEREIELHGTVSSFNPTSKSFQVRGVKVTYTDATRFDDGTAANLGGVNVNVEVRGQLSADGSTIAAERIKFEH